MGKTKPRAIGKRVRADRVKFGLTQLQLARRTRMSRPQLSALENCRREPTLGQLRRLGRVLRISAWSDL